MRAGGTKCPHFGGIAICALSGHDKLRRFNYLIFVARKAMAIIMADFAEALQRVQTMLATEEGRSQISSLVGNFSNSNSPAPEPPANQPQQANVPDLSNLSGLLGNGGEAASEDAGADKTQLLQALRPHLSSRRLGRYDAAMKLVQVSKYANLRNLSGISNILNILGG